MCSALALKDNSENSSASSPSKIYVCLMTVATIRQNLWPLSTIDFSITWGYERQSSHIHVKWMLGPIMTSFLLKYIPLSSPLGSLSSKTDIKRLPYLLQNCHDSTLSPKIFFHENDLQNFSVPFRSYRSVKKIPIKKWFILKPAVAFLRFSLFIANFPVQKWLVWRSRMAFCGKGQVAIVILWDQSTAFDTNDYLILCRLHIVYISLGSPVILVFLFWKTLFCPSWCSAVSSLAPNLDPAEVD